ncbi:citrate synthase family protein [Yangia mangrovi]|uniref:citrate synthase (unknown stereospecificity) n=1 Tax=Alloyangia mangrovi TaxID=1779329 RepID=A0ABT2KGQ2_9RHOB|nr:citrate synthase family protein [Alloyangia mangrovi]MCT4369544.1 citrate synthase family protein [Alloyangia mangrovi]
MDWIDAGAACALLGVKPQTLYAYVSRGQLRAEADAQDARRSLYFRPDVETLLRQNRRPRARAEVAERAIRWGDPVLVTGISEVRDGMLWLRGRSVEECAESMTPEQMATHLCGLDRLELPDAPGRGAGDTPAARAVQALSAEVDGAVPLGDLSDTDFGAEAARLISLVANALLGRPGGGVLTARFGAAWGLDGRGEDDIRRALVLLSDHELNPSTFAVRIAASTGASLPAALLCGLATLSGPRHGGASALARAALEAAMRGETETFLATQEGQSPYGFGYGHPLYLDGDPRSRLLLERLPHDHPVRHAQRGLSARLGQAANVDTGLAALELAHGLPRDAGFTLFATARLAGWIAHAREQARSGALIRPRARYVAG